MPDVAHRTTDLILGRGLITAETIYQEVRERIVRELPIARGRCRRGGRYHSRPAGYLPEHVQPRPPTSRPSRRIAASH